MQIPALPALRVPSAQLLVSLCLLALARVVQGHTHLRVHQRAHYALLVRLDQRLALQLQLVQAQCRAQSDLTPYLGQLQVIPHPLLSALYVQLGALDLL